MTGALGGYGGDSMSALGGVYHMQQSLVSLEGPEHPPAPGSVSGRSRGPHEMLRMANQSP